MSCSPFDLADYLFGELGEAEGRQVEKHVGACGGCQEELERLRVTHQALLTLRDEELPQRIGFVSDKVFEPSPVRRALQSFWASSARLGFASAAMLAVALVAFTFYRPAVAPVPGSASNSTDAARIEAAVASRLNAAVDKAVAESEARQAAKTEALLSAANARYEQQRTEDMARVKEAFSYLEKRYNTSLVASNQAASSEMRTQ